MAALARPFQEFPYEVLEAIVFWIANGGHRYKETPPDFTSFVLTCRNIYNAILGTPRRPNHNVLAQICRFRYDTAAPQRRLGHLTSQILAEELKKRCPTLRRIAACVLYGEHVVADLWVVLLMLLEDDGRNMEQLVHAGVERWVKNLVLLRINEQMDPHGWPVETELIQLAAAIFTMVATRARASAESEQERDEIMHLFHPFMFGAHRYPIAHLPTTQYSVSSTHRLPPSHTHTFITQASAPVYDPTAAVLHFGRVLTLSRPLVATSAILATYLRRGLQDVGYRRNIPVTRAQAIAADWRGAVQEDYLEVNRVRRECLGIVTRRDDLGGLVQSSGSKRWDADFWRLVLAHKALDPDPYMDRQLKECWFGTVWEPGMFSGKWVGRYLIPSYPWYTRMLAMHPHPLSIVEATLPDHQRGEHTQAMQLTLREHIATDILQHVGTGDAATGDGVQNGWFHDQLDLTLARGGMVERTNELVICDPREPDPAFAVKRYQTWYPGMELPAAKPPPPFPMASSSSPYQQEPVEDVPADVEMIFDEEGVPLGPDDSDSDDEMDAELDDDDDYPASVDVIITGETDYAHGAAWGACRVYGRVRRNDGLVVLLRVPEDPQLGLGRWIFRGYIRAGHTIVGRWRETGTSMDVAGYESSFALCKVDW